MFCKKCGNEVKDNEKFCKKCGSIVGQRKENGYGVVSLVLGFVSLFLCFTLNILTLPLSIIGIVFGLVCKDKCTSKTAGIIINIISIIISIVVFIVLVILLLLHIVDTKSFDISKYNDIAGEWNCKINDNVNYNVTLNLNKNFNFSLSEYNNQFNNASFGNYIYIGNVLTLFGENMLNNGILKEDDNTLVFKVTTEDNHLLLENKEKNITYTCDR